jgi:UrcA family protein
MRSKTCTLLVSALAVAASSVAMADALVNVKSETVRYDDLRLTSQVGVAVLYGRLRGAADRACGPSDSADLPGKARYRTCYDGALAKAVATVDHPGLTQYHELKRGTVTPIVTVPSVTVVAKTR